MSGTHGGADDGIAGSSGGELVDYAEEASDPAGLTDWLETLGRDVSDQWRRRVGSAVVVTVGLLLMGTPLYHLTVHGPSLDALLGDLLPLGFGGILVGTGVLLWFDRRDGDSLPLVTAFWVSVGFVSAGIVSIYVLALHVSHGHVVEAPWFLAYDMAATGAVAGLLVSRYDVRARRRYRQRNRRERQFRAVFEGTLDALVIADDEGEYVAANPAAAALFGLPRSELVGKTVADFAASDVDAEERWRSFREEGDQRGEFELRRADGEVRTVAFAATADVVPGYHLSALRDVTERVERERQLAEERARIEFLNQLLRHNILNGMNLVLAKLDALEPAVPEDRRDDVGVIRHRGEEIVDLVQTARRLSTAISDDTTLERVDLVAPLTDAVETVRSTYPDATVEFSPPDDEIRVRADDMIGTVFDHLLTNAVEHNDPAALTVTVDVTVGAETVTVTVADDGVGIPAERRRELFDQGSFTRTRDWGGFGLSIVDVLVQEYGGRVWAESNDPSGVVFTVELERADGGDRRSDRSVIGER